MWFTREKAIPTDFWSRRDKTDVYKRQHERQAGTEHILIAMLKDVECAASRLLNTMNVNVKELYSAMPVSYTHLDVYKRQEMKEAQVMKRIIPAPCAIRKHKALSLIHI